MSQDSAKTITVTAPDGEYLWLSIAESLDESRECNATVEITVTRVREQVEAYSVPDRGYRKDHDVPVRLLRSDADVIAMHLPLLDYLGSNLDSDEPFEELLGWIELHWQCVCFDDSIGFGELVSYARRRDVREAMQGTIPLVEDRLLCTYGDLFHAICKRAKARRYWIDTMPAPALLMQIEPHTGVPVTNGQLVDMLDHPGPADLQRGDFVYDLETFTGMAHALRSYSALLDHHGLNARAEHGIDRRLLGRFWSGQLTDDDRCAVARGLAELVEENG